ncbi:MAG TPA: phosphate regulon sensor histidine kinase PhoR [Chromatiales bacterium]|nr:phosphate regulon sensor histidine kinase PhoR [Chromatiales bacterium]
MIRAWRNELACVAGVALALVLIGLLIGDLVIPLGLGLFGYFAWHLVNFLLLQSWIWRRRSFRLPVSFGVWEAVFDGLQRELSRRQRRGQQLISNLSDCREAAETLPDAIVMLSETATVRWCNAAARRLLGLRWPADRGIRINRVVTHPVLEDDLNKGESSRPLEVPSPANGAWMLSIQVTSPFGDERERLLVARNITPLYRLEQARRDFLANVSHELRTPITVFRGYLDALQDLVADHPQWRTPVDHMGQQILRMQALVNDLLTLSRLEMADRPHPETAVPVSDILEAIVTEARLLSGEQDHDLRLSADPNIWLRGDESELHSAFSNLVFNAVRHTPPGTRVDIKWQGEGDGACLSIHDHGLGIAAHHLPRLTERFYVVEAGRSRQSSGSGLGLAIVKQVLDRYSGELAIESVTGEGTAFRCRFPASLVESAPLTAVSRVG